MDISYDKYSSRKSVQVVPGHRQGAAEFTLGEVGKQNIQGEIEVNQVKREMQRQRGRKVCEVLIFHFEIFRDMAEQDEAERWLRPGCEEPCVQCLLFYRQWGPL